MRNTLLFLFALISFSISAQVSNSFKWSENYRSVLEKAKKNKKPVLVYFSGSDWCGPCKRLKKDLFDVPSFSNIAKDYNMLYIDIPQKQDVISEKQYKHNKELMHQLNPNKVFPTVLILDKKGNVKDKMTGYSSIEEPTSYLNMINKYRSH